MTYVHRYTSWYIDILKYVDDDMCIFHIYIYIDMYVYMYMCVYKYIHTSSFCISLFVFTHICIYTV